jgi:hypothetical protein
MTFETWCKNKGGEIEKEEGELVCKIKTKRISDVIDALGMAMERTKKNPDATTLFTSGPKAEQTDFVVYDNPALTDELLRVRYEFRKEIPEVEIKVQKRLFDLLEEAEELV